MDKDIIFLTVNGKDFKWKKIQGKHGQTMLEIFRDHGIHVPTLCYHPKMPSYGGCRLCIVEIENMRGLPPSCTPPAADRMVVHTHTDEELEHADVVLITGSNTTEMHPVIASVVKHAVRNGNTKLILVEPRKIDLVDHAEIWLRQKPGSDVAWLNGMMQIIIKEGLYAKEYVAERTEGFEALQRVVAAYTPEKVASEAKPG